MSPKRLIVMCWLLSVLLSLSAVTILPEPFQLHGSNTQGEVYRLSTSAPVAFPDNEGGAAPTFRIATGFFIHSLAFISPSDVNITGYMWQHYPYNYPQRYARGIIFPEEVNASNSVIQQRYKRLFEEGELIGWYFDITLRQSFDYSHYPLDRHTIWLRLWPAETSQREDILIVPDYAAYQNAAAKTFGLDSDIVPGEWEIGEVFFSYNPLHYDTNFGFTDVPPGSTRKELYYNIVVKRKFINAFIINLAPLLVVAILLYAALLTMSGNPALYERLGFSAMATLSACSALFFVVMMAHIRVRSLFSESGLVYIEYFYLVMYAALLLVVINAYFLTQPHTGLFRLLHYRDNLIPKVTYWPVLSWSLAAITRATL